MKLENEKPLIATRPVRYLAIQHHNSNRAARRGLCGWTFNRKTGKPEFKNHVSLQIVRHPDGEKLPHSPLLTKRNKYMPHVGKKQLAKAQIRQHVSA